MKSKQKMNLIKNTFQKNPVFIAYITAGHKGLDYTKKAALALIEGGVDILEIGVPFSDPVADGPVIQQAMSQSLSLGTNIDSVLETIAAIKKETNTPIVLFTYYNPLLQAKIKSKDFFIKAHLSGVDGILVVDLPIEESEEYHRNCHEANISPIYVVTPSTPLERIRAIQHLTDAFIYYACRNGTTGIRNQLPNNFKSKIKQIKKNVENPVVGGFGISTQEQAASVLSCTDGFVIGSLFVKAIEEGASPIDLKNLSITIDPR